MYGIFRGSTGINLSFSYQCRTVSGPPFFRVRILEPEENESAVAFRIHLTKLVAHFTVSAVDRDLEPLRDGGLHLCDSPRRIQGNIGGNSMTAMHDERPTVHSFLGRLNKILDSHTAGPGGINLCFGMKDGREILPFRGVPCVRN